jgi:hypothetical protein
LFSRIDHLELGGTGSVYAALGFALERRGERLVARLENTRLELLPDADGIRGIALEGDGPLALAFVRSVRGEVLPQVVHPNGAYKLERVYIAVKDVARAAAEYAKAFGVPVPKTERGTVIQADMVPFNFGETGKTAGLTLAQPVAPGVAADALARRGEGPFQALFRTRSMEAAAKWLADHGVPPPARGIRNTGEQAMLVPPEHACGAYIGFVGPA